MLLQGLLAPGNRQGCQVSYRDLSVIQEQSLAWGVYAWLQTDVQQINQ